MFFHLQNKAERLNHESCRKVKKQNGLHSLMQFPYGLPTQ